jgi:hypothetical protein
MVSGIPQGALTRTVCYTNDRGGVFRGCESREHHDFEMSLVLCQFSIQSRCLWYQYRYRYSQNIGDYCITKTLEKLLYNKNIGKLLYNKNIRKYDVTKTLENTR